MGNEASDYPVYLGEFSGNTTDAFTYHHGRSFSTSDRDNDLYKSGNCAEEFTGGWWYDRLVVVVVVVVMVVVVVVVVNVVTVVVVGGGI